MSEKRQGPTSSVRLIEVSVNRQLTVLNFYGFIDFAITSILPKVRPAQNWNHAGSTFVCLGK